MAGALPRALWYGTPGVAFGARPTRAARDLALIQSFTREAFAEAWARDDRRPRLFDALLAMLREWAFAAPVDGAKWGYLEEHVFAPLAERVWSDAGRFARLQEAAKQGQAELERQCRALVADVANDAAGDGGWICAELDDIKGDVARGALKGDHGGACWLHVRLAAQESVVESLCHTAG